MESTPHTLKYAAEGQPQSKKLKPKKSIHTHIHSSQPLMHSLVLQERCNQTCFSPAFQSSWGLVTPRTPDKTPLLPAESHRRCPIPLHTASKVWLCLHFINHTILSVTLLHTSRPMQNPLASSKPISLSAHALLTPSLHLKGDLPLPLCLPLLTYTLF